MLPGQIVATVLVKPAKQSWCKIGSHGMGQALWSRGIGTGIVFSVKSDQ